jgi:hypothetical protein
MTVIHYTDIMFDIVQVIFLVSRDSSMSILTGLQAAWPEEPGFDSWQEQDIPLLNIESVPVLGPTQPPVEWVLVTAYMGVKQPGREADQSSSEVKNSPSYITRA